MNAAARRRHPRHEQCRTRLHERRTAGQRTTDARANALLPRRERARSPLAATAATVPSPGGLVGRARTSHERRHPPRRSLIGDQSIDSDTLS